jgi:hypothetical protein|tara:strand:+ start:378 stop:527 length:150 start_codon:yes stop_codon:yes gene_type:complete
MMTQSNKNNKSKSWQERTTKEKLDMVFIIVAIVGFSLGAIVNYKLLTKK